MSLYDKYYSTVVEWVQYPTYIGSKRLSKTRGMVEALTADPLDTSS